MYNTFPLPFIRYYYNNFHFVPSYIAMLHNYYYYILHNYYPQLFVWRKEYLEQSRCETGYTNFMNGSGTDTFIYCNSALRVVFGSQSTKIGFYLFHATFTISFTVLGYICFHRYTTVPYT